MEFIEESGEINENVFNSLKICKKITELTAGEMKKSGTNIIYFKDNMENSISKKERLAMVMYDKYCDAVGGKAFNGDPLPKSGEFFNDPSKQKQALAWIVAAEAAVEFFISQLGS